MDQQKCTCSRRAVGTGLISAVASLTFSPCYAGAQESLRHKFVVEAERMRDHAVAAGDQSFGAIVVKDGEIVGYGPSRVIIDRNPEAHAERVAIWDAQRRLGTEDLSGTALYSTSRACAACENAAAKANMAVMYFGPSAVNAGKPRGW
jgi:tRNA(adenine34) deaminase